MAASNNTSNSSAYLLNKSGNVTDSCSTSKTEQKCLLTVTRFVKISENDKYQQRKFLILGNVGNEN